MEPDGTEVTTSGEPHQLVYMCRQHYKKKSHMNKKKTQRVYVTQVQVSISTVPMQLVCPERSQKHQAANNVGQPCQLP